MLIFGGRKTREAYQANTRAIRELAEARRKLTEELKAARTPRL